MVVAFYKYHGTGNDFILLDNREGAIHLSTQEVAAMCCWTMPRGMTSGWSIITQMEGKAACAATEAGV